MRPYTTEYDSFIFTHIPKCAGTSFRSFISKSARKSGISRSQCYIPGENWLPINRNYYRLDDKGKSNFQEKRYKVIAMHVDYNWHLKASPYLLNPFYYTLLRNPIDRVLSHYQFFNKKKGRRGVKGLSLENLDKAKRTEVLLTASNSSIIYLTGGGIDGQKVTRDMMDDALEVLTNKYGSFGVVEKLNDSIELLQYSKPEWLELSHDFEHKNKLTSDSTPKDLEAIILEEIRDLNSLEITLYEKAKEIFFARIKAIAEKRI